MYVLCCGIAIFTEKHLSSPCTTERIKYICHPESYCFLGRNESSDPDEGGKRGVVDRVGL